MTRIGVSGHRQLRDEQVATATTEAVLNRVLDGADEIVVVSSVAEGADRLVADLVLTRPGATMEIILPLPADDFLDDFDSEDVFHERGIDISEVKRDSPQGLGDIKSD